MHICIHVSLSKCLHLGKDTCIVLGYILSVNLCTIIMILTLVH